MPRPRKFRRICEMPTIAEFGPLSGKVTQEKDVFLTVDEFETLRLIDLEHMTQEECAKQMNIARTTAQKIYNTARTKLAFMLVNGVNLKIQGGDYILCEDVEQGGRCGRCRRKQRKYYEGHCTGK